MNDRRRGRPSPRRAPYEPAEKGLCLYADKFFDFNVKHFHEQLVGKHGLSCSYTWTKNLRQEAGYVKRSQGRGGHRQRRPRRPRFGQMLHLDGSDHEWLATQPGGRQVLLLVVDDATGRNLAARLVAGCSGCSPALPYPPLRRLYNMNMAIALKNQPDILCPMKTGHLYVLLTPESAEVDKGGSFE